jgi:parallel beta-helix repeat protein
MRLAGLELCLVAACVVAGTACFSASAEGDNVQVIVVTNNLVLEKGAELRARLVVRANHVTIDGNGGTLVGPGTTSDLKSLEQAGIGILVEGVTGVTLTNIHARGFATGLVLRQATAVNVVACDFSDNYHNPGHGWDELPARGGILLEQSRHCVIRDARANRVWNGLHLIDSDDNLVEDNDFSKCSNTCAKLWKSSRNKFLRNNLSYGLRIDLSAGEVHARDSTGVLIETGSDDNYWYRNDITHGGDGIFIRPLNRWVSRGNVFVENDTSYANNNCIESWSPGNIYIRNKANHGSYGFWLGGSDHTVLIGNEASYNGLTNGFHNAPEPGFGHGGIVIVGGPSSHTIIQGNDLHYNNGAGLAFRGDVASQGKKWRTEHWVVQQNRMANNQFGIWGRWGDAILLSGNVFTNNARGNYLTDLSNLVELSGEPGVRSAPVAELVGPELAIVNQPVQIDATRSHQPESGELAYHWYLDGQAFSQPVLQHLFTRPGFYRLGLTVENGSLAALAWRDVLVIKRVTQELGTEGQAALWSYELESSNGNERILFADDSQAISGARCLRFSPDPYPGAYVTAVYPGTRDARWNFTQKKEIQFWLRATNPNVTGWQNAGPVIRLIGPGGQIEYKPVKDGNLLNDPPCSEARWLWAPFTIPLTGSDQWLRQETGNISLERVDALSISVDSWGMEPFTIWLDGLTVE